jgi:protocatechuate 3,4-dioxygenase beta subunit
MEDTMNALVLMLMMTAPLAAQDAAFLRAYERAQEARPATVGSVARIAPEGEPGTPLVILGRVYQADGRSPAAGVLVFAYQTDARGLYDDPSAGPHSWRLKGWARTDSQGRFEFRTIRPASYPNSNIAQHVHVHLEGDSVPRGWSTELHFEDDPKISARERDTSRSAGQFGLVRPVVRRNGVDQIEAHLRIGG